MSDEEKRVVFVSSCMLGKKCLYHGYLATFFLPTYKQLQAAGVRVVDACPEMLGGLPCPRPPSRIREGRVLTTGKKDITGIFKLGARKAFRILKRADPIVVLLLTGSPACDPEKGIFGIRAAAAFHTISCQRKNDWLERLNKIIKLTPPQGSLFQ